MKTIEIIHKLSELGRLVDMGNSTLPEKIFSEKVKKVANELIKLMKIDIEVDNAIYQKNKKEIDLSFESDDMNQLFRILFEYFNYHALREICKRIGVEI